MDGTLTDFVSTMLPLIGAAALIVARPLGFIIVFPVFSWLGLQGLVRIVTALVIGFPLLLIVQDGALSGTTPLAAELILSLAAKEFLVGAVIGLVLGAPFWAAETAGTYIDVYRGAASSTVASPDQMSQPLITGAIFSIALVAIFLVVGGLPIVIGALYQSFEIWPLFELMPKISEPLLPVFFDLLANVFKLALALGAPILIAMFLGELALAYASRFAQHINVFDATLSAKNLIFLLVLPPYLYMLISYYADDVLDIAGLIEIMGRMVSP